MENMENIETLPELNSVLESEMTIKGSKCILSIEDNKSSVCIQQVIVDHPISFIRNLQEFCKTCNVPVSDVSVLLVGFVAPDYHLIETNYVYEISPFVYFKKPEEVKDFKAE